MLILAVGGLFIVLGLRELWHDMEGVVMTEVRRRIARPMTEEEKRQAREAYVADASATVRGLADRFGVSDGAMARALKGVTRRPGGRELSRITTDQMRRLADSGLSLSQIAVQAGITVPQVSRRLRGMTH